MLVTPPVRMVRGTMAVPSALTAGTRSVRGTIELPTAASSANRIVRGPMVACVPVLEVAPRLKLAIEGCEPMGSSVTAVVVVRPVSIGEGWGGAGLTAAVTLNASSHALQRCDFTPLRSVPGWSRRPGARVTATTPLSRS